MRTVSLISLGCAKNLVDSEIMVGHLRKAGMSVIPDSSKADAVIINTCAFLESSKQESINTILEAHQTRARLKRRALQKIIVAGCLSQRYPADLPRALPEVDAFIGLDQITQIAGIVETLFMDKGRGTKDEGRDGGVTSPAVQSGDKSPHSINSATATEPASVSIRNPQSAIRNFVTPRPAFLPDHDTPRHRLTPRHYAYLKIAEGCNHPCAFCIIPQIRGRHRSRTIESVVTEARNLVAAGAREINLVSQDTTFYGMDTWARRPGPRAPVDSTRGSALTTLLRELQAIPGDFWIRLLYTHPAHWSDELIRAIAECDKVVRYVDMPLQHISDNMLRAMRRETDSAHIRDLVRRIRAGVPGIALRTTFIVGFPGETGADVDELCEFIRETKFERLGVFRYSREENTRAAKMPGQVSAKQKDARWHRVMALQKEIAAETSKTQVGRALRVLVEKPGVARGPSDAPDIDGRVYVPETLPVGEFATVKITGWRDYDLIAS